MKDALTEFETYMDEIRSSMTPLERAREWFYVHQTKHIWAAFLFTWFLIASL